MIKLIIFDAGGVLYKGSIKIVEEAVKKFLTKHGIHDLKKSDKIWSKIEKLASTGKITAQQANEKWLENLGLLKKLTTEWNELDKKEIWAKFKATPRINKTLKKLKKNQKLAVLSDTIDSKQEKIEKMQIVGVNHTLFDEIYTSHDLGAYKPSKKAFNTVLKKFDVKPQETLFISDACDELKGARKIGIITVGYNSKCGQHKIKNLNQIQKIIEKHAQNPN